MHRHGTASPLPGAPELCVEVLSSASSRPEIEQKTAAYLAAGAIEVWLIAEDGGVEMRDRRGRVAASALGIVLAPPPG